jgi:hypothetical protein
METQTHSYTAFGDQLLLASGPIENVALTVQAWQSPQGTPALIFEDQTGQQIDLDLRGTPDEALERLRLHPWFAARQAHDEKKSGPGRPKLGVVSREVSLLPRHWDWLNDQPGGASASLRKLVEEKMKTGLGRHRARQSWQAASKFMWAMAGNMAEFEEASRAFTRKEYERFDELNQSWPADVRDYVRRLVTIARQDEEAALKEA